MGRSTSPCSFTATCLTLSGHQQELGRGTGTPQPGWAVPAAPWLAGLRRLNSKSDLSVIRGTMDEAVVQHFSSFTFSFSLVNLKSPYMLIIAVS